jgi:hypothetical protein
MKFRSCVGPPEPMRGLEIPRRPWSCYGTSSRQGAVRPAPRPEASTPDIFKRTAWDQSGSSSADSQEQPLVTEARADLTDGPRGYRFGL